MKKFSVLFMSLVVALGFASCSSSSGDSDPKDTTVPSITILEPTAGASFMDGTEFTLEAAIIEETALKSWSYSISLTTAAKKNTAVWTEDKTIEVATAGIRTEEKINIKDQAQLGTYTIKVNATDLAGNKAVEKTTTIEVTQNTSK